MLPTIVIGIAIFQTITATLTGEIYAHDPSFVKSGTCWYVFSTGYADYADGTPQIRRECDGKPFELIGSLFKAYPTWLTNRVHPLYHEVWAPDINYINGQWYVYYSGWRPDNSSIGLATATNIEGPYTDHQEVIHCTYVNNSSYVCIDPEIAWVYVNGTKDPNQIWLVFGSFSDGIKAHKLDPKTGLLATDDTKLYSLAKIGEAASVTYHNGYYYLFVSDGKCCSGVNSTYHILVGRSKSITGPYVDQKGVDMVKGGGTLILSTKGNVIGPGGEDVYIDGDINRMVYHYYDGAANGRHTVNIVDLKWTDDWPSVGSDTKIN